AVAVFTSATTVHFHTPMLGAFAAEFGVTPAVIGWVPTLTFGGFLAGIVFLVPLGDRSDKRRLILVQLTGLLAAVIAMAAAPTLAAMLAAAHGLGPTAAGLVGIPGAAGILVARAAGRALDRRGPGPVVTAGIAVFASAFVVLALGTLSIVAIVVGAVLLDCG